MSATYINLDPIAQSIRSFGSGLANNALKKAQLDRQLQNDIVAFNKAQADIDYTKARNAREETEHGWKQTLVGGYNPELLNPHQQNTIAVNTMAGRNVALDAIKAAKEILNPEGSSKSTSLNMSFLRGMFPKEVKDPVSGQAVVDINGAPKYELDRDAMGKAYTTITGQGLPFSQDNIIKFVAGLLTDPQVAQAIAPTAQAQTQPTVAPVATNLPTQGAKQPTIPKMTAADIIERFDRGDIDLDEARKLALINGIKWD